MKKLNITKEQFNRSRYFKNKYGKLEYVSESGKVFKTSKGKILKFKESRNLVKESVDALATPENVKVDDILYCTSYYDYKIQTFYKVLAKRGASTLVIQRVYKEYDGTQSDGVATPSDKVDSRYRPITVRYGKRGFKVGSDKLYIWDGSPLEEYNYSESGKKPRFGRKFKESASDIANDPAYKCPYCGSTDCEFDTAEDIGTGLTEGYFDGATFNAQYFCNKCNKPYNVQFELKVKDVYPNEDADELSDDWA